MSNLTNGLVKSCADFGQRGEVRVDLAALIEGLILYDRFILHSVRFLELSALVQCFGVQGLLELIEDGALELYFDAITVSQVKGTPKGIYRFESIKITDPVNYQLTNIESAVEKIPGVTKTEKELLISGINRKVLRHPDETIEEITTSFKRELQNNNPTLAGAISKFLIYKMGVIVDPNRIRTEVEPIGENLRIGTNLGQLFRINEDEIYNAVGRAALAIAGRDMKLAEMRNFKALLCCREDEVPLFEQKYSFLAQELDPVQKSKGFDRVLKISNFPDFKYSDIQKVDATKILDLRRSVECREFRSWLSRIESVSDKEIEQQVKSLRTKVGNFLNTGRGKSLRFLLGAAIGGIPYASVGFDALDTFIIEKIFPSNAAIAFLQKDLPSIFEER